MRCDRNRSARRRRAAAGLATLQPVRAGLALALVAACAAAGIAAPAPSPAPSPSPSAAPRASGAATLTTPQYTVETKEIDYQGNGDYTMPGPVKLTRPGSDATADSATGNAQAKTIALHGNVVVHDSGQAPEATSTSDEYAKGGPSTLTTDELDIDALALVYTATGHVHYTQGKRELTAERGTLNRSTHKLHLEGNVRGREEDGTELRASTIDYDTASKDYVVNGKPLTIIHPIPSPTPGPPGASPSPSPKPKHRFL